MKKQKSPHVQVPCHLIRSLADLGLGAPEYLVVLGLQCRSGGVGRLDLSEREYSQAAERLHKSGFVDAEYQLEPLWKRLASMRGAELTGWKNAPVKPYQDIPLSFFKLPLSAEQLATWACIDAFLRGKDTKDKVNQGLLGMCLGRDVRRIQESVVGLKKLGLLSIEKLGPRTFRYETHRPGSECATTQRKPVPAPTARTPSTDAKGEQRLVAAPINPTHHANAEESQGFDEPSDETAGDNFASLEPLDQDGPPEDDDGRDCDDADGTEELRPDDEEGELVTRTVSTATEMPRPGTGGDTREPQTEAQLLAAFNRDLDLKEFYAHQQLAARRQASQPKFDIEAEREHRQDLWRTLTQRKSVFEKLGNGEIDVDEANKRLGYK
ncbi:MAG: hypothetical protein IT381_10450 [Deltaproteobacteria bacterium]|nr:hypothetical protein [Deltaproteobacteria bacterium]